MNGSAIVELARAAVRRLAEAAPTAEALDALARIERVSLGPPYTIAIAGDQAARSALLDWLAGERLFDPVRRDPDRIVLTLQRGPITSLLARRRDGSLEEHTLDAELPDDAGSDDAPVSNGGSIAPIRPAAAAPHRPSLRASAAQGAAAARAGTPPAFRGTTPSQVDAVTKVMPRPPPWWAVWRWLLLWWRAWRSRQSVLALLASSATAAAAPATGAPAATPAPPTAEPAPARRTLANTVARGKRAGDLRQQFVTALSACLADDAVERLFVKVGGGPLPGEVVVIELPPGADARSLEAAAADACLVACGERGLAMTAQLETVLTALPHLFAVGDGELAAGGDPRVRWFDSFAAAASGLIRIATIERTLAAGALAVTALTSGSAALDAELTRAETGFRARLDQLEALRIASPDDHVAAALARIRPQGIEHAQRQLRGALDQLDRTIVELGAAWAARLGAASSADALRAAAAQIDDESPAALEAAQAAVHRAMVDALTEHARAHYRELAGELGSATVRPETMPAWLTVDVEIMALASGTSLGAVAPRLTSLFRSLDTLKAEALAQLDQRIVKLRQVASANVLDTEPRLEPAVAGAIAIALRGDIERHTAWLDAELARERAAIDAELAQLAPLALARDAARGHERELVAALGALAAELP